MAARPAGPPGRVFGCRRDGASGCGPALHRACEGIASGRDLGGGEQGFCRLPVRGFLAEPLPVVPVAAGGGMPGSAGAACRSLPPAVAAVRLPRGGMPEPFGGQGRERRVEFDAGEAPAEGERGQAGGAGARERVEHGAVWLAPGLDAPGR